MAAYVKFVEQMGAQVIPIFHTDSDEQILELMTQINGVIFPGGGALLITDTGELTPLSLKGKVVLDKAKELNEQGIYFPVLGICMGFEEISVIEAPYPDTLMKGMFDSQNISNNVTFVSNPYASKMYRNMPEHLIEAMQLEELTFNAHHDGVFRKTFRKYPALQEYQVLSVQYDRHEVEYVSAFEHKRYPIYGLQYHPEKNAFIWKEDSVIPHSEKAIELEQYYARFFVTQAKMNNQKFKDTKEKNRRIIENYSVVIFEDSPIQDSYVFNLPIQD